MKPFLLRHGPGRWPLSGLAHEVGEFDSQYEAEQFAENRDRVDDGNWAQIIDCQTQRVLRSGSHEGTASQFWWTWRDGLLIDSSRPD